MEYIYIFHHATEPRLKIGKACNPLLRAKSLQLLDKIDPNRSHQLLVPKNGVFKIEKFLHFLVAQESIELNYQDGYTEWFSSSCYSKVLKYLKFISDEENYQLTKLDICTYRQNTEKQSSPLGIRRKPIRLEYAREFRSFIETCSHFLFIVEYVDSLRICFSVDNQDDMHLVQYWFSDELPLKVPTGLCKNVGHKVIPVSVNDGRVIERNQGPCLMLELRGPNFMARLVTDMALSSCVKGDSAIGFLNFSKPVVSDRRSIVRAKSYIIEEFRHYKIPVISSANTDNEKMRKIETLQKISFCDLLSDNYALETNNLSEA